MGNYHNQDCFRYILLRRLDRTSSDFLFLGGLLHSEMDLILSWTNWSLSQNIKLESEPGWNLKTFWQIAKYFPENLSSPTVQNYLCFTATAGMSMAGVKYQNQLFSRPPSIWFSLHRYASIKFYLNVKAQTFNHFVFQESPMLPLSAAPTNQNILFLITVNVIFSIYQF